MSAMPDGDQPAAPSTSGADYAQRLVALESVWWKRLLDVQRPYRWNLKRNQLGRTLDVGCGIGRNLATLAAGSVGVDHNAESIALARQRGFTAYTAEEFFADPPAAGSFDSMLLAHVAEHLTEAEDRDLLDSYLPFLRQGGRVMFICPQRRGYRTDATHVWFAQAADLARLAGAVGLRPERSYSFPLPAMAGGLFTYNETCVLARKPG
ncbi:MAG: class I SAM-dependent methyltransferase [Actinomycetota bacterium]|nr:class I SAM-dependent methyltransferase [Actinomycetota bacterium]MDQ2957984.1 class I SAM-dependent methyltransferase [Actinomycetota bacterium]